MFEILTKQFDSFAELTGFQQATSTPSMLFGGEDDTREYFCLTVHVSDIASLSIGLRSYGIGLKPGWRVKHGVLFIGFNQSMVVIDLVKNIFIAQVALLTLFWDFIETEHSSFIIVLCETAIVAVSDTGSVVWRVDTDLINNYKCDRSLLSLDFLDSPPMRIDLENGTIITAKR